jgi:hypothetical protein
LWGTIQAIRYCEQHQTGRFNMISALKAEDPSQGNEAIKPYLVAKRCCHRLDGDGAIR